MKLLIFCIVIIYVYFKIREILKPLAWGNYIDAAIQSCDNNETMRNLKFLLNNKILCSAEQKFNIKIHLPPKIKLKNPLHKNENKNHILFPDLLKQPEIKQYIWELQLKRTYHLKKDWTNYIVIHLRLGDVPFVRHPLYKLFVIQWYRDAIKLAKHYTTNCKVIIVCNLKHLNKNLQGAKQILHLYALHLNCSFVCDNSEEEDIHCFMNCAVLISTISSFSFYAGLVSKNLWITTTEYGDPCKLVHLRKGILYLKPKSIAHEKVKSYNDINDLLLNYQE